MFVFVVGQVVVHHHVGPLFGEKHARMGIGGGKWLDGLGQKGDPLQGYRGRVDAKAILAAIEVFSVAEEKVGGSVVYVHFLKMQLGALSKHMR